MLRRVLGIQRRPELEVFRGFGSQKQLYVLGRVKETSPRYAPKENGLFWTHVRQLVSSYLSKPFQDERVTVRFHGEKVIVTTDAAGLFEAVLSPVHSILSKDSKWITVEVELESTGQKETASVLVEGRNNTYGVISDIDDTILVTNATNKLRLLYLTFTKNSYGRKPFAGVSQLYQALIRGNDGHSSNPIMYVSSSHWNLFYVLTHFFKLNTIPIGPLFLKKYIGLRGVVKGVGNHAHKKIAAQKILDTYPDLPFILIGDTGQQDAQIYSELAIENEGRILTIYIRDVTKKEDEIVEKAVFTLGKSVELVVVKTSEEAAVHARSKGYIA